MTNTYSPLPPPKMSQNFGGSIIGSSAPGTAFNYGQPLANYHTSALGPRQRARWVWDNRPCSITEFAELAYGDTAQRTQFLLKYSGDEQ